MAFAIAVAASNAKYTLTAGTGVERDAPQVRFREFVEQFGFLAVNVGPAHLVGGQMAIAPAFAVGRFRFIGSCPAADQRATGDR